MSRQIGEVPTRIFSPGEIIFHEGEDPKGEAFIVHIGRVEIRKRIGGEDRLLRVLGKGDLLGDLLRSERSTGPLDRLAGGRMNAQKAPGRAGRARELGGGWG
jgi:hypothetical protein